MAVTKSLKPEKWIFYVGDDDGYWASLKSRFKLAHPKTIFGFRHIAANDFEPYQLLFLEILKKRPDILYLDFSFNLGPHLKLANLLKLENSLRSMPVVGLVDKKSKVEDSIFAGVDFTHVKCGEFHDVVFDPYVLAFPKAAGEAKFAKAQFHRDASLISDFRIGYMTPTTLHAEGDMMLEEGSIIELNTNIPKTLVPSRRYRVKSVDDKNLFYNYRYCYDLEFLFVDEPENEVEKAEDETIGLGEEQKAIIIKQAKENQKYAMAEYHGKLDKVKKNFYNWVMEQMSSSHPKKTKVMIVDEKLDFIGRVTQSLDSFPYTIRLQTRLSDDFYEIYHTRPDIIAMQFYDVEELKRQMEESYDKFTHNDGTPLSDEEIEEEKSKALSELKRQSESAALDLLSAIVKKVKSFEDYRPFIVLFSCENYESSTIQDSLKYPYVIANKSILKLSTVTELANAFQEKNDLKFDIYVENKIKELKASDPMKYSYLTPDDFTEKRYYISRQSTLSRANFRYPITLNSMSESELTFSCDLELRQDVYRLDFPVDMSLTVVPISEGVLREKDGKDFLYRALIHSVGEIEKKTVRKFVNEIFFSDLTEKRKAEMEAFKNLNEQEKQKRQEELEQEQSEAQEADGDNAAPQDGVIDAEVPTDVEEEEKDSE